MNSSREILRENGEKINPLKFKSKKLTKFNTYNKKSLIQKIKYLLSRRNYHIESYILKINSFIQN